MSKKALTGPLAAVMRQLEEALKNGDTEKAALKLRRAVSQLGPTYVKERIPEQYHSFMDQVAAMSRGEATSRVA